MRQQLHNNEIYTALLFKLKEKEKKDAVKN